MVEQSGDSMDTETQELVASLAREIIELKEQVAEKDSVITIMTGELIKRNMDPDYLAA